MVSSRVSSGGKYRSVTVTFIADSRPHVEAIYRDLHEGKRVLFDL
jgi:putative lipoic acid-binding regulatory protein